MLPVNVTSYLSESFRQVPADEANKHKKVIQGFYDHQKDKAMAQRDQTENEEMSHLSGNDFENQGWKAVPASQLLTYLAVRPKLLGATLAQYHSKAYKEVPQVSKCPFMSSAMSLKNAASSFMSYFSSGNPSA
jgi:hypothetical protein